MPKEAARAFRSWDKQRARCRNKKQVGYTNYGGKGICVEYSAREFVGWWLKNIDNFKGGKPTVGRIKHDKNYCFGNIFIQDRKENSSEVYHRLKKYQVTNKIVIAYFNGKAVSSHYSTTDAAKCYGYSQQLVSSICNGKRGETSRKIYFMFKGE